MSGVSLILPWKGFTLNTKRNFESSFLSDYALINVSPPRVLKGKVGILKYKMWNLHPLRAHLVVKSPLFMLWDFTILNCGTCQNSTPGGIGWCQTTIKPRSHHPCSFWLLAVWKDGGGRNGPFYLVNDISLYLGRQRGGGVSDWKNTFRIHVLSLNREWHVFLLLERSKL